jgi:hypothetical protein
MDPLLAVAIESTNARATLTIAAARLTLVAAFKGVEVEVRETLPCRESMPFGTLPIEAQAAAAVHLGKAGVSGW